MSLEKLLDHLKVKKTKTKNGKRKRLTLHARIEEYELRNKEVADQLLAIKWIGNEGSHDDGLSRLDLVETYQLYEYALKELFGDEKKKLDKIKKGILKKKGKRKR